jgi:PPOX class probable F420-dependent enzyme
MTDDETRDFLRAGTRTAKLATVAHDGSPRVVPIWFVLADDGTVVFTCDGRSLKAKSLRRDPRIALCVDLTEPPYAFVEIIGTAQLSEDVDELRPWATLVAARYMGTDRAEEFGRRNAVPGELLVRVTPTKVIAVDDMSG